LRQFKVGRAGIGIAVLACIVALAAPAAMAVRGGHSSAKAAKAPPPGDIAAGQIVFNTYFCSACHKLQAAGPSAYGQLGVDLSKTKAPYEVAKAAVTNGLPAALPLYPTQMVGYKNVLTEKQIVDVASFVAKYSGGYYGFRTCKECQSSSS
jgi:mono/diheme cytochrome c family protein